MFFDYGYKDTAAFSYFQIFLNFFYTFFSLCSIRPIYRQISRFACVPLFLWSCSGGFLSSSGVRVPAVSPVVVFRWCSVFVGVLVLWWSCVLMAICPQSYARAYIRARAYARTRTGIFRP